jgi:hypothetical protein
MKLVAVYLVLVGVPFAGLAAILHAGNALHAPAAIAGEWRVEGAGDDSLTSLTLSQSGEHVDVAIGARSLRGRFAGDSVVAERRGSSASPSGCSRASAARLSVRIDTAARPMRLWGAVTAAAPGCGEIPIAATHVDGGR